MAFVGDLVLLPRRCGQRRAVVSACVSRRDVLQWGALAGAAALGDHAALARVNIDIDRYGDKEMKVSAINRVKQNLRNALGERPQLLASFVAIPVLDALNYNISNGEGGPDASLAFEMEREGNAPLREAFDTLKEAQGRSREEVSLADFFYFAGAVALETTGGPRIVIQIGREDAEEPDTSGVYEELNATSGLPVFKDALKRAGRDAGKEAVVFYSAIQTLSRLGDKRQQQLDEQMALQAEEDDGEGLFRDRGDLVYGEVSRKKKGAVLVDSQISNLKFGSAKFDNGYLKALVAAQKKDPGSLSDYDRALLADPACMPWVTKYASDNRAFINDFANGFEQLSLLGIKYEQAKLRDD